MSYPIPPIFTLESDVTARLAQQSKPLLLSFTASWCQPCKSFAPVLGAVHSKHGERIDVIRVDIDACPDLARQYGIRGVPTSILLRDGVDHDRFVGAQSERVLVQWLIAREIELLAIPEDDQLHASFGAFYGDDSLKQFLVERLCRHMDQGDIEASLFPSWLDGKGTVSCAVVHHSSPEVFEYVTGLPAAFGSVLEFVRLSHRNEAEEVFQALSPGQDVGDVPLRLIRAWLGADVLRWEEALGSTPHDTVRRDWLALTDELLGGAQVPAQRWTALRDRARALVTADGDPYHQLGDDLGEVLTRMSPPADAGDGATWGQVLLRAGFAMMRLTEYAEGWTTEDSAMPAVRHRFFTKHVPLNADGSFDQQLFEAKRAEWERDNADFVALEGRCDFEKRVQHWNDLHAQFRPVLVDILRGAQAVPDQRTLIDGAP